jgi:fructose-1-phosphate kinase PfkB-like protein
MARVLSVGLSPTLQKTISFGALSLDRVNRSSGYRLDASGKAVNAARVLNQLSPGVVACLCPLGADNASLFLALSASDGLAVEYVPVPGLTRHCYTLLETGTGRATELVVNEPPFPSAPRGAGDAPASSDAGSLAAEALLGRFDALLSRNGPGEPGAAPSAAPGNGRIEAVLLAGSRPAGFPDDLYARLAARALSAGALVLADYQGADLLRTLDLAVPSVIKINEEEFCATFGYPFPADESALLGDIAAKSAELGNLIVVTRGSRDTVAASRGRTYRQPVMPVDPVNVIGCGDSFAAGLLFSLLDSPDVSAALEKATWCASRNALSLRPGSVIG